MKLLLRNPLKFGLSVIGLVILLWVGYVYLFHCLPQQKARSLFKEKTTHIQVGQDTTEVLALLGVPSSTHHIDSHKVDWYYNLGSSFFVMETLKIRLEQGRVDTFMVELD